MIVWLHPSHPYDPGVGILRLGPSVFCVKWRDFSSVKQDGFCTTREAAEAFAADIRKRAKYVDLEILEGCGETFDSLTHWWGRVRAFTPPPRTP